MLFFIFTVLSLYTARARDWADITIQNVSVLSDNSDGIQIPLNLPNDTIISPAVGYYDTKSIHLIDIIHNKSYYADVDDRDPEWNSQASDEIFASGGCITSSCFTQLADTLYIIYDETDKIIEYDMNREKFLGFFTFNYPGYYCLVSDDRYIYAIGDQPNILILDTEDFDQEPSTSTVYLPNHISNTDAFTCAIDNSQTSIYIFTNLAIFSYSISDDTLSTLYTINSDILPYNHSAWTAASGPNDLIWIQNKDHMYPFSSTTNKFLNCRAPTGGQNAVSLLPIDQYVLRFGGPSISAITMVDATFYDKDRFQLNDYYHPSHAIGFSYSQTFSDSAGYGSTTITLTSSDFAAITDSEIIVTQIADGVIVTCGTDTNCGDNGLSIDIADDMASFVHEMNSNDMDITDISYSIEATSLSVEDSASDNFVCNSFVIHPVYLRLNVQLLSAEYFYLKFDYEYACNGCNETQFNSSNAFESELTIQAAVLGINAEITMKISNSEDTCEIVGDDEDNTSCDHYILYDLDKIFFNGEYTVSLSSGDTFLESNEIDLKLSNDTTRCRRGTGYNEETNSCYLCPVDTFSFISDLRACQSCKGLEGVSCEGSDAITVQYRYWLTGYRKSENKYITLFEMYNDSESQDDYTLISHICGFGQCCEQRDGCDYLEAYNSGTLCSTNRDITSAMCTKCDRTETTTYYELLSSNNCGVCEDTKNMWHLLWMGALAFLFTLFLAFVDAQPLQDTLHNWRHRNDDDRDDDIEYRDLKTRKSSKDNKEDDYESESDRYGSDDGNYKQRKPRKKDPRHRRDHVMGEAEKKFKYFVADSYLAYSVLILQIFTYYFQGYAEILESQGTRAYLGPIVNFFNMSFNNKVGAGDGYCFIPKQSASDEIGTVLMFPALMMGSLLLMWMFCFRCRICISIQLNLCGLQNAIFEKPYISIAMCRVSMIILGLLFRVLMHLVTCTQFKSYTDPVQFYHEGICYKASWFLAFTALIIFVLYIISIYNKLYHQSDSERFNPANAYFKLVAPYKNSYWYWEAIVTLRRFLLTMFVSLSFIGGGYSNLIFCVVLLMFLFAQILLKPYSHKRNNRVETFCILSLLIAVIALNFEDISSTVFVSFLLGIVIFLPVLLALVYLYQLCNRCCKYFNGDEQYYLDYHADAYENEQKELKVHHQAASSTEKMMTRVLKKVPTEYFEKRKAGNKPAAKVDIEMFNTPDIDTDDDFNATPAGYKDTEMVNLAPPHDSDSSCGLSEN